MKKKQLQETKQEETKQEAQLPIVEPTESVKVKKYGTKDEVYNGVAEKTRGKLTKDDLFYCEKGKKVKSKKMSEMAKARFEITKK